MRSLKFISQKNAELAQEAKRVTAEISDQVVFLLEGEGLAQSQIEPLGLYTVEVTSSL